MASVNDEVFGVMEYKHRWVKKETIYFFGKSNDVTIAAKAYKEKPITEQQRNSYKTFKKDLITLSEKAKIEVVKYLESIEKIKITSDIELNSILSLKTVLFTPDGNTILLFNSKLDEENGIGIQLYPSILAGPQDIFL